MQKRIEIEARAFNALAQQEDGDLIDVRLDVDHEAGRFVIVATYRVAEADAEEEGE